MEQTPRISLSYVLKQDQCLAFDQTLNHTDCVDMIFSQTRAHSIHIMDAITYLRLAMVRDQSCKYLVVSFGQLDAAACSGAGIPAQI